MCLSALAHVLCVHFFFLNPIQYHVKVLGQLGNRKTQQGHKWERKKESSVCSALEARGGHWIPRIWTYRGL